MRAILITEETLPQIFEEVGDQPSWWTLAMESVGKNRFFILGYYSERRPLPTPLILPSSLFYKLFDCHLNNITSTWDRIVRRSAD